MIATKFQVLPHCKCLESFTDLIGTFVCIFLILIFVLNIILLV